MLRLTEYFINNPRVTNMVVVLIFIAGIFSAFTLKREQFPAISMDIIQIQTLYPGAAPEDVEINVTNKIEEELLEVENIRKLTSMSMENISIVVCLLDSEAGDPDEIKADIRDAVARVTDLPESVTQKPVIKEITATNIPVLEMALYGDASEYELRKYARSLESRLKDVSGVSSVEKIGYRKREVKIDVNLGKMKDQEISFTEIMHAISARNVRLSGGTLQSYVSEKKILTLAEYDSLEDVGDVIVRSNFEGYHVLLSDIAVISDSFEEPRILYRGNGRPAISLIVTQQENADIIDLSATLKKEFNDFNNSLPDDVRAEIIYDYSVIARTMLNMVVVNGVLGFVLVIFVLFVFLDVRSAFWAAFGIPFSIIGTLFLFTIMGISLNVITLSTMILVVGIIVDDAIVITEKIYSLKQEGTEDRAASIQGVKLMLLPVSAAVFTTILGVTAILFVPGVMGKFTGDIPKVVALLLGFSLVEAVLFIPSHLQHAKAPEKIPWRIRWLEPVKAWYRGVILAALRNRIKVMAGFALILVILIGVSSQFIRFMLDEDIDIDFFAVVIETPQGTSLEKTRDAVPSVEKLVLDTVPDEALRSITTEVGHHNVNDLAATAGQYSNWAVTKVYLKTAAKRDITSEEIMADLAEKLPDLKKEMGLRRLNIELMSGLPVGRAVEVIFMTDDDELRGRLEKEMITFLNGIEGVRGIESSNVPGKDELRLILDYKKLARVGLTALDVARTVRTAFDGTVVTSIRREGEDVDFRVRIQNPKQYRAAGVLDLPVANREGRLVPILHFAKLFESDGPAVLHHYRGKRSVTITANVDSYIITSQEANRMIREKFRERTAGIPGLRMKLAGQEEETETSMEGFFFALVVVLISVYFLLVVLFNSYLQPALIMSVIPFAVVGAFLTLILHGRPLIFISLMGILGLIGVVVNDTIVMITHLNATCREEGNKLESIANGAVDRFRPVILTTLTTFAGLLPTSYGFGGDIPSIRPLVLVMAWGLLFATFITLGFIPTLYSFIRVGGDAGKKETGGQSLGNDG